MAKPKRLLALEIDEVSCVDAGANPHAAIVLAKRNEGGADDDAGANKLGTVEGSSSVEKGDDRMADQTVEELKAELKKANERLAAVPDATQFTELQKRVEAAENDNKILKQQQEEAAKRAEEAAKVAKAEKDLRLVAEFKEVAKRRIGNLSGEDDKKANLLKSLNENLPQEDYNAVMEMLEQGNTAMGKQFQPVGQAGVAASATSAQGQLQGLAKARAAEKGITYAKALDQVSHENPELYAKYKAERRAN